MDIELKKLGLNEKEEKVYLTLLRDGVSSVLEVTKHAGLNRTTGYDVLRGLIEKGLVVQTVKRHKKMYAAEPPDRLVRYAEKESEAWQKRAAIAQQLVPLLSKQYRRDHSRPAIQYFEGLDGIKEMYEDSLTARDMIRSYSAVDELKDLLPDYAERYFKRRTKKRIYIRAITKYSEYALRLKRVQSSYFRELRIVPGDKFNFTLEKYIYNNKVSYMSLHDRFGVIVVSDAIATFEKFFFELAWQAAKEYDREVERKLGSN